MKRKNYCSRQGQTWKSLQPLLSRLMDNIGQNSPDQKVIILSDFDGLVFGIGRHEVDAVFLQSQALQG